MDSAATTTRRRCQGRIAPKRDASLPTLYSTPSSSSVVVPKETQTKRSTSLGFNDDLYLDDNGDCDNNDHQSKSGGEIFGQDGWLSLDQSIILQYHFDFNEVSIKNDVEDTVEDNESPSTDIGSPSKGSDSQSKPIVYATREAEEGNDYRDYYADIKSNIPNNNSSCSRNDKYNSNNNSISCFQFGDESQKSCALTERTASLSASEFSLSFNGSTSSSRHHVVQEEVEEEEEEETKWRHEYDDNDVNYTSSSTKNSLEEYSSIVDGYEGHTSTKSPKTMASPSSLSSTTSHNLLQQNDDQQEQCIYDEQSENEYDIIEVAPGISLPLKGTTETLEAIYAGHVTIARCCCCRLHLHCIDVADLVICPDCFVLSPIDISDSIVENGYGDKDDDVATIVDEDQLRLHKYNCVGIGFKTKDILARLEEEQQQQNFGDNQD